MIYNFDKEITISTYGLDLYDNTKKLYYLYLANAFEKNPQTTVTNNEPIPKDYK